MVENNTALNKLLQQIASDAATYSASLDQRSVFPSEEAIVNLAEFDEPLPEHPQTAKNTYDQLHRLGSPATVSSASGRYFGFVTGSALPATLAANWLAGIWDQNAAFNVMSPIAAKLETIAERWLIDLFGLPSTTRIGFVTGATMANFTALAAARHALLLQKDWNVEENGLFGAPLVDVIVGNEVHASVLKALSMLGFGRKRVTRIPVDSQGRIIADRIPEMKNSTLICTQAGNVNTGASDPIEAICDRWQDNNVWVHVDGAFGLWSAVSPRYAHLVSGIQRADSWAVDAHKWLNTPYDSGLALIKQGQYLQAAFSTRAAYLMESEQRDPADFTPEMSRRGRGIEIWAALKSLGRNDLIDLIERHCDYANRFAEGLADAGFTVLNDVVLNQVMVSFGTTNITEKVISAIQEDGTCWCGGTTWQGQTAMRISVSSWRTTEEDVEVSLKVMIRIANEVLSKVDQ